jgi:hypothetical protein
MNDHKLPGLARATDDEAMRVALSAALPHSPRSDRRAFTRIRHQVLKYTPGKRCVIEYRLEPDGGHAGPRRVIGKLYRQNRGEKVFANLQNLWLASSRDDHAAGFFGMPEPLAYLPDIGMVLQSVVAGQLLANFSEQDDLATAIRYVAHNLAALHGLPVTAGETRTMEGHIRKYCHPGPHVLMEARPDLAPLVERLLDGLAKDESLRHAPLCPVHGDLGLAQIFIAAPRAFFIDFDGFCLSHAALDICNFLAALKVHFGARSEERTRIFLETYLASQPPERLAGLKIYQAFTYLRRAMICFRWQAGADWRGQAQQLLETANAFLEEI